MIDLIWIKRKSSLEDSWLKEHLEYIDPRFNVIVVGHTDIKADKFKYFPFWENGLDEKGLICHKKNIGVQHATEKYCLILHADVCPDKNFYNVVESKKYSGIIAPYGTCSPTQRGLTWCRGAGIHKDPAEAVDKYTYISGAAIFGERELFLKYKWNESLSHNQGEDVEYSQRLISNNVPLSCDKDLVVKMRRFQ